MESSSILVVDDEPGIALLCERILRRAGYSVESLTDPRIALELLHKKHIDLLLVDIRMPEVDGFDVITHAQKTQPDIAVLVMTGFGTVETAIRALRQGVDGLLLKPFEKSDELLLAVKQAMADNQRKRDVARIQTLRPLFNVTESLLSETDQENLLKLIVDAICNHLYCRHAAYYAADGDGKLSTLIKTGKEADLDFVSRVYQAGTPLLVNATGPGESEAQAHLASLGLGAAILIPITRPNQRGVLFAGRDPNEPTFRDADLEMSLILTRQAAIAMENARLYADLRAYVRRVEESQQALLQAEKMAAAGRLTASIAHEVNNPLQSVQNCLHLAGREDVSPEKRKEYFDLARTELERLMITVQRMLDFYRPGAGTLQDVNLLELLQHVLNLTSQQLHKRGVQVITNLPDSLPTIKAVDAQIQQIFINLILNAFDAMPGGGELKISARALKNGIEMFFQDDGPGIPKERRANIFEPFYSTKEGGTGLGLTVSYNIVTSHGGTLELVDGRGPGACFRLFMPTGVRS